MCKSIAGCLLIIINIIFLLIASALIVVGAILQWGGSKIQEVIVPGILKLSSGGNVTVTMRDLGSNLNQYFTVIGNAGLILFIIGIILFVICLCGTCGVCCESRLLMIIYLIFTTIIWVLIVIFIIVFFTQKVQLRDTVSQQYVSLLKDQYKFNAPRSASSGLDLSGIIDIIQARLECCGAFNYSDFDKNPSRGSQQFPSSCCKMVGDSLNPQYSNCTSGLSSLSSNFDIGCFSKVWNIVEMYSNYAAYALIGLGIVLLIIIIVAGVLTAKYRRKDD